MTEKKIMPKKVSQIDLAFPVGLEGYLPPWEEIPDEFKRGANPYVEFQRQWFYNGLPEEYDVSAKPGVDLNDAMRHLKMIQGSFEPKHEHKEAGVAYLASLWLSLPGD